MKTTRSRSQGLSLVEALVYCVLLGIFTSIFFVSLPTRGNASSEDLSFSVEQTSLALSRLHKGLSNSLRSKVFLRDDGKTIIFLSATDEDHSNFAYDKSGNVLWRQWDYYTLEDEQISHYAMPLDSLQSLAQVGAPDQESRSRNKKILVDNVSLFQVQKVDTSYRIRLEVTTRGSTYSAETLARPRN